MSELFTPAQQKALAIAPKFTSFLSLCGNGFIIFSVLSNKRKRERLYHRILLAVSVTDWVSTLARFFGTWPSPSDTPGIFGAHGTTQTCTAQGFFISVGISTPMYIACLSLYFLVIVKYGYSEQSVKRIEKFLVFYPLMFGTLFGFILIGTESLNNSQMWCWIDRFPFGCEGDECERGAYTVPLRIIFSFVPVVCSVVFSTYALLAIYYHVVNHSQAQDLPPHDDISRGEQSRRRRSSSIAARVDIRRVVRQSSQYLLALYVVYTPSVVIQFIQFKADRMYFTPTLISALAVTSLGSLNALIYRSSGMPVAFAGMKTISSFFTRRSKPARDVYGNSELFGRSRISNINPSRNDASKSEGSIMNLSTSNSIAAGSRVLSSANDSRDLANALDLSSEMFYDHDAVEDSDWDIKMEVERVANAIE
eukprot:CAMPEP_0198293074 /NCGR_PEP_ID=MMETSP1449-20131203/15285_1 /TAXON_ID=420275 /ORGANISM="Attheya septentrionalis, Strain CCMP2084" /LENGTH=421 /DNA_ID=CAMNT_0043992513 /DNA_START=236 /DNA_END=1498 /DNA_ORIENTATION=+